MLVQAVEEEIMVVDIIMAEANITEEMVVALPEVAIITEEMQAEEMQAEEMPEEEMREAAVAVVEAPSPPGVCAGTHRVSTLGVAMAAHFCGSWNTRTTSSLGVGTTTRRPEMVGEANPEAVVDRSLTLWRGVGGGWEAVGLKSKCCWGWGWGWGYPGPRGASE